MATTQPNPRASLLAGLRTGGVRSTSMSKIPQTSASDAVFNVPRFNSATTHHYPSFSEEEENQISEMQGVFPNAHSGRAPQPPMTPGGPRFGYQQNSPPNSSAANVFSPTQQQAQAFQMQMMQMEIIRLQAQQYQAELLAQTQRQLLQQQQMPQSQSNSWRANANPPSSAGPYDQRFPSLNKARGSQVEQLRSKLGLSNDDVCGSPALSGKFSSFKLGEDDVVEFPTPPGRTTVISGGTVIGSPTSYNINISSPTPSKSDSAASWRRNGKGNSVLNIKRAASVPSPTVKVTPPPEESAAPQSFAGAVKSRPHPLQFDDALSQPLPVIAIDSSEIDGDDTSSSGSSRSNGSPTTPSSNGTPLSPREEASKKLYEGLGIGRPSPAIVPFSSSPTYKFVTQPTRQPRGPPSGADELGPKNFATRIRRRAIGGLNVLLESRERRDVELY